MNERDLFIAALQIEDPAGRAAYLDKACGGDAELRQRVEILLTAFGQAGSFLQEPAAAATSCVPSAGPSVNGSSAEGPGAVIGPYKLLQQIGEGGMGTVYLAEQTQPVQRKVALKVIKAGMDSRRVITRFEAERQALAMMDHVNIARVLDVGATDTGLPYFVMELVHGVPITSYCDDNQLTPRQRLELFVPVCQAIQRAHQKGIIHRDIKPSNVMITLYDGRPVPKVIDFGVAKATEQPHSQRTQFTQDGMIVGTLEYMSPEQADLSPLGVDTRSDIYSLGVLLYELLTGSTPLTHQRLKEAAFAEILRMIKEEEPARPSTRLSDSGEALASISAQRQMEPARLAKLVRGELDWIVMKTLEKDRNRRYETANGLALDIERYLHDEPVRACPPSALYRFRKFARRNKRAVAVAVTAVVSAVAAVILTVVLLVIHSVRMQEEQDRTGKEYQRAECALRDAEGNLQRADQNLGLALEALDDLCLKDVENRIIRERRISVAERESLQRGLAFYERFAAQNSGHAELQGVMAKANRRAGFLRLELKDWQEARAHFTKAIPILEQLADDSAVSVPYRWELARCCYGLSLGLVKERRHREAEPICRRAIALLEKLAAQFPHEPNYRVQLGHSLWQLGGDNWRPEGGIFFSTGRPEEAEKSSHAALRVFEALAAEYPKERFYRQEAAFSHRQLSSIFASTGRPGLAVASRRQAIGLYADLAAEAPNDYFYRREVAYNCSLLGNQLQANQRTPEAEDAYRQALTVFSKLVAESNQERDRWQLGSDHEQLGQLRKQAGQLDEAAEHLRAALVVWEKLVVDFNKGDYRGHWSGTHRVLAEVLFDRAREMEKDTKLSLAERQAAAQAYRDKARKVVRDGIFNKSVLVSWTNFAEYPEAEALLMETLAQQLTKGGGEISLEASFSMHQYAHNYLRSGKYAEAELLFRACLPIREKQRPNSWMTLNTRTRLGAALLGQKKYAEAEPFLLKGYEGLKQREPQIPEGEKHSLTDAVNWLIELYDAWGQNDKADQWRQKMPRTVESWLKQGEMHQAVQKWEPSLLAYKEAAKLVGPTDIPNRLRLSNGFRGVAGALQNQAKYAESVPPRQQAAAIMEYLLAQKPAALDLSVLQNELAGNYASLGVALARLKHNDASVAASRRAIALWKQLRQADPDREWYACEEAHFGSLLAVLLESMGRSADALEYARTGMELHEKLLDAHPNSKEYRERLGGSREALFKTLSSLGRGNEIIALQRKNCERNPDDASLVRRLAQTEASFGRWDDALDDFSKALELNDSDWGIWDDRGCAYLNVKQPAKALADFTKSLALHKEAAWVWYHRGLAHGQLGNFDRASADYAKVIELEPTSAAARNNLAWLLATCPDLKIRDPKRAVELAKKAAALAPKEGTYWNTLGVAQYRAGDCKAAIEALGKSMELGKGGDAYDWFFLAMAHEQDGHHKEAGHWYAKGVQWLQKNEEVLKKDRMRDEELRRFRAEAEELLKIEKKAMPE